MPYHVLLDGKYKVYAYVTVHPDDWSISCPALDFMHARYQEANYKASSRGFKALFLRYSQYGRHQLTAEMMHEANKNEGILEFIKGSLRIFCFVDGNAIVLTNGCIKKTQRADPQAVAESIRHKKSYFDDKRSIK